MSPVPPPWHLVDGWAWRVLLWQWGLLLALFMGFRLAFLARYWTLYKALPPSQVALSLLVGVRFDASVVMVLAGIPGIAFLLLSPWQGRLWPLWVLFAYWAVLALVITVLHAVDLYYYGFVGRRVSFEAVSMLREWRPVAVMVAQGYVWQTVGVLALLGAGLAAAIWGFRALAAFPHQPVPAWSLILQAVLLLLGGVLVGRGGLQTKPLSEGMAFRTDNMALGHLSLNPVFTSVLALDHRATILRYYPEAQAERATLALLGLPDPPLNPRYPLLHQSQGAPAPAGGRAKNLVILTIESFSPRFIGAMGGTPDVTPRFDALTREGMFFNRFYASGTRSLEGIPAILTGYPALPTQALLGSPLEQSGMSSIPQVLKARGYHTLFLHAAFRGTMWFDQFANRSGFDRYLAKEDIPDYAAHSDSTWGVYDHFALERLHEELLASPKPVFAFFFSLSSHTPYELPDPRFKRFPDSMPNAKMLNSFAYTDYAIGHFFDLARQSPYWKDTVFMITADHNLGGPELTPVQRMHIPLLILAPGDPRIAPGTVNSTLSSQVDMAPTALDLLGVPALGDFVGTSLLRPRAQPFALFAWGGSAGWLTDHLLVTHDLTRPLAVYDTEHDPQLHQNVLAGPAQAGAPEAGQTAAAVEQFQSYLQTVNNLLVANRVYPTVSLGEPMPQPAQAVLGQREAIQAAPGEDGAASGGAAPARAGAGK